MRRALGVDKQSSALPEHHRPPTPSAAHRGHRRFVRDGEVPVVIRSQEHEDGGSNKLDQAQQGLREQIVAREQVEQRFRDALATIEHLQTKLAHEQIARAEALQRAEAAQREIEQTLLTTREELGAERQARQRAEQERDDANAGRREVEERFRAALVAEPTQEPSGVAGKVRRAAEPKNGSATTESRSRRPKIDETEADTEFVEWWQPGWQDRFR